MVDHGLARRLGLAGGPDLAKTSWSCQDLLVLPRPPSLARCLVLDPWEHHDVLGTWDNRYLKDTFDL